MCLFFKLSKRNLNYFFFLNIHNFKLSWKKYQKKKKKLHTQTYICTNFFYWKE